RLIVAISAVEQQDATVDELDRRERLAARSDLFEHQAHEFAGSFGALRLKARGVALTSTLECLPRRAGDACDEHEDDRRAEPDCEPVPPHEFAHSIGA